MDKKTALRNPFQAINAVWAQIANEKAISSSKT